MVTGTWALACVLLTAGGAPPDAVPFNQRNFEIPISIDPASRPNIRELILFVSSDQGAQWRKTAVATPDKATFPFYAPGDGLYWFSVAIVDQRGIQEPADIHKAPPKQKILVDTVKPEIRVLAERQGDEIVVRWELREEYPDLSSLKLEYRLADTPENQWTPVAVTQPASNQAAFRTGSSATVYVRMQVRDLAENVGTGQAEAAAAPAPMLASAPGTPPLPQPSPPGVGPSAFVVPPAGSIAPPGNAVVPPTGTNPSAASPPPAGPADNPNKDWRPIQPASLVRNTPTLLSERMPVTSTPAAAPAVIAAVNSGNQLVASTSDPSPAPAPAAPQPPSARPARGQLPDVKLINTNRVTLDYEVERFGPSGLGSVELYYTRDDGRTWMPFGDQQRITMPPPAPDGRGPAGSLKRSLTIQLPEEGLYGFYLVVKSGAGLGKPPPQSGEQPQMRLEVDATPPVAKLFAPEPDASQRDSLVLTWSAGDRNLTANPITLEWAERKGGSWQVIGQPELPNTSRFTWQVPANMPPRVLLRLTVRDAAGNVGVAETGEPVLVDLNEPVVKSLSIGGISR